VIKRRFAPYFEIELLNTKNKSRVVNVVGSLYNHYILQVIMIIADPPNPPSFAAAAGDEALFVLNCCANCPQVDCAISGIDGFSRAWTNDRFARSAYHRIDSRMVLCLRGHVYVATTHPND